MTLEQFCIRLSTLELTQPKQALAILWFYDCTNAEKIMTSGLLARIIHETGLGNPHSTQLKEAMIQSGLVLVTKKGLKLKVLARSQIRQWLVHILEEAKPEINHDSGYLSKEVWDGTRGYIEKVCEQLNGCYHNGYYDAASVMMRRLVETLVIEAYESLKRDSEIRDSNGNFMLLRDLVGRAIGSLPIGLGRDAKDALGKIKEMGDRSAHNRRYSAVKSDMDKIQSGLRVVVDELINIASLRNPSRGEQALAGG